ncbi:hypothetical protein CYY_009557 [Polysphondylium violaceum]|uniref:FNIP repeat-containing protein n=1 Tax=Polysphondylium violaceum TaxID=133409 RepID=A0A8J4PLL3_9MYCE|nr:hypothetical protein CYY_009557 [Polysphondylium violaceum]
MQSDTDTNVSIDTLLDPHQPLSTLDEKGAVFKSLFQITNSHHVVVNNNTSIFDRMEQWSIDDEFDKYYSVGVVVYDKHASLFLSFLRNYIKEKERERKSATTNRNSTHTCNGYFKDFHLVLAFGDDYTYDQHGRHIVEIVRLLKSNIISIKERIYEKQGTKDEADKNDHLFELIRQEMEPTTNIRMLEEIKIEDEWDGLYDTLYDYSPSKYRVHRPEDLPVPHDKDFVYWENIELEGAIPDGVHQLELYSTRVAMDDVPQSVRCLVLNSYDNCLSNIRLPPKLKFLYLNHFFQFIYRNIDIPETVTHLKIDIDQKDIYYCWLRYKGTLPRHVTHLNVSIKRSHGIVLSNHQKVSFLIPTSVQYLDIEMQHILNYQIVDETEYYKDPLTRDSFKCIDSLKSIKLAYDFNILSNSFPGNLQILNLNGYTRAFDTNVLPASLTSYTCSRFDQIPNHIKLNYLEYMIDDEFKLIFKSNDRSITRNKIPGTFDPDTGAFDPQPTIPIDEFHCTNDDLSVEMPNAVIRKVVVADNPTLRLPDSTQVYESLFDLPPNYPASLHTIIIKTATDLDVDSIPPTVKQLHCYLTPNMMSSISKPMNLLLIDKYKSLNSEPKQYNGSVGGNQEFFFQIWRSPYLNLKIYEMNLVKRVDFKITRTKDDDKVFNFKNDKDRPLPNQSFRFREGLSIIPHGVSYYSIPNAVDESKDYLFDSLPSSLTKLKMDVAAFKRVKLPPTIKHLSLISFQDGDILKLNDQIPSSVEVLKLKFDYLPFEVFGNKMVTFKQLVLSNILLSTGNIESRTIKDLNARNLFGKNEFIKIYCKPGDPISPSTTVLVWALDQVIPVGLVPFGVKRIVFDKEFNQTILENSIPLSVTDIYFGFQFNQCFSHVFLPASLKILRLSGPYDHPIHPNSLPPHLAHFTIKLNQDHSYVYYQSLIHLPKSVRYTQVNGFKLKQDYDNKSTLFKVKSIYANPEKEDLNLVAQINEEIGRYQDKETGNNPATSDLSYLELHLTTYHNSPILPGSLNHLNIKSFVIPDDYSLLFNNNEDDDEDDDQELHFNQALLAGSIPSTVTRLEITNSEFTQQTLSMPSSITQLVVPSSGANNYTYHHGLKSIEFQKNEYSDDHPVPLKPFIDILNLSLPNTVEEIIFRHGAKNLNHLPSSVTKLGFASCTKAMLDGIPPTVTQLEIDTIFDDEDDGTLLSHVPSSITKLKYDNFEGNIEELPATVKSLHLQYSSFTGKIPPSLEYLEITELQKSFFELK